MDIKTKLQSFREKIDKSASFDDEFRNLVGVELYDFIQNNKVFKNEFDKRFHYLKNLVSDKSFNRLQDDLFLAIQKILKLTSTKKVQEKQVVFHNAYASSLKTPKFDEKNGIKWLELPDLYSLLQDKKNYFRLGDDSLDPEICLGDIETIERQYKQISEFFEKVFWSELIKGKEEERKKLGALWDNYKQYYDKLDDFLFRAVINLHLESFEKFVLNCRQFYPRRDYERYHHDFSSGNFSRNAQQFEETKKAALRVIDDLLESFSGTGADKIRIFISKMDGVYAQEDKKYPIKGNRLKLLQFLKDERKDGNFLSSAFGMNLQNLSGTIRKINTIFKKKLELQDDLIVRHEKGGYQLNGQKYEIKFS